MFPPKPSQDPKTWLSALWSSLQRAGHHFGQEAQLQRDDDGTIRLRSKMNEPLPPGIRPVVLEYMKQYARACGWTVKVTFPRGYCEVQAASRAASSASRKA